MGAGLSHEVQALQEAMMSSDLRFAVMGNCQMSHVTRCLQAFVGGEWPTHEWINPKIVEDMKEGRRDLTDYFERHDKVFMQSWIWAGIEERYRRFSEKVVLYPNFLFLGYQPDLVYITDAASGLFLTGPCGHYHSCIALLAWKAGLPVSEALKLYRNEIYRRLGFFSFWEQSCTALRDELRVTGLPEGLVDGWIDAGCFMYSINHPKLSVMGDVIWQLLRRLGVQTLPRNRLQYARDFLADSVVWPVYPEIAEHLGISGSYLFKLTNYEIGPDQPVRMFDLEKFVTLSYRAFSEHAPQNLLCGRLELPVYLQLQAELRARGGVESQSGHSVPVVPARVATTPAAEVPDDELQAGWLEEARRLHNPAMTVRHASI